jgi:hypothetical protein
VLHLGELYVNEAITCWIGGDRSVYMEKIGYHNDNLSTYSKEIKSHLLPQDIYLKPRQPRHHTFLSSSSTRVSDPFPHGPSKTSYFHGEPLSQGCSGRSCHHKTRMHIQTFFFVPTNHHKAICDVGFACDGMRRGSALKLGNGVFFSQVGDF